MFDHAPTLNVPLRMDHDGAICVGQTRVTLDVIIARHHQGDSPEAIHEGFPTIPITDIYAVIAYYLANRIEMDDYLRQRDKAAARQRAEIEANYSSEQRAFTERVKALIEVKRKASGE